MSYENAPATKMLATHCAVCGRPLVDSVSVETGIGPDCREKHGYNIEVDPDARTEANKLVHAIAVGKDVGMTLLHILSLRVYGFNKLADIILDRKTKIVVEDRGAGCIAIKAPYSETFTQALKTSTPWRKWDGVNKVWVLTANEKVRKTIWKAMKREFPGVLGVGPKGPFAVAA